jgi:hypothetical protein
LKKALSSAFSFIPSGIHLTPKGTG